MNAFADVNKAKELSEELRSQLKIDHDTIEAAPDEAVDIDDLWKSFRESTVNVDTEVLGFVKRKHQYWFDENDEDI